MGEPLRDDPIFFAVKSTRLHTGIPKNVSVFVNLEKVKDGEVVLFESTNSEIQVEPDSKLFAAERERSIKRYG